MRIGGAVGSVGRVTGNAAGCACKAAGKRWPDEQIPNTSWDIRRFVWQPEAELRLDAEKADIIPEYPY